MSLVIRRPLQVFHLVEGLRQRHLELTRPLTWHGIQRILAREGVRVMRCPVPGGARVLSRGGVSVIALDSESPARHHTGLLAHEWGHILLHSDDGDVVARQVMVCRKGDPRELEAKLFARLLLMGPHVTLDDPTVAPITAKLERAGRQFAMPLNDRPAAVPKKRASKPAPEPKPDDDPRRVSSLAWTLRYAEQIRKAKRIRRY